MAELKYKPVPHDHKAMLAKARTRKGFAEAYDALALEYQVAGQMLKARSRAGRVLPVLAGFLAAAGMHALCDSSALVSDPKSSLVFVIYGAVMVPLFIAMIVVVVVARRNLRSAEQQSGGKGADG